jgi:uncharacterized Zn finger protein (UPF0148 family)
MIKEFEKLKAEMQASTTIETCEDHGGDRCLVVWDRTETGIDCPVCNTSGELESDIAAANYNEAEALRDKEQAEEREATATKRLLKQAEQISELEAMLNEFKEIYEYGSYHSCSNDLCENYQTYKEKYK